MVSDTGQWKHWIARKDLEYGILSSIPRQFGKRQMSARGWKKSIKDLLCGCVHCSFPAPRSNPGVSTASLRPLHLQDAGTLHRITFENLKCNLSGIFWNKLGCFNCLEMVSGKSQIATGTTWEKSDIGHLIGQFTLMFKIHCFSHLCALQLYK